MNKNNMRQRFTRSIWSAVALVPLLGSAQTPAGSPAAEAGTTPTAAASANNARQLGVLDSLAKYCGTVDPAAATKLQGVIEKLTAGLSAQQIDSLRQSDEYRLGASSVEEFTSKVDPHNSKRMCSESLRQQGSK